MQFVLKHLLISQPFSRLIAKCLGSEWETGSVASNDATTGAELNRLAYEFKRISGGLCWLCINGLPERWIIILS
jgi:hypothetical protein